MSKQTNDQLGAHTFSNNYNGIYIQFISAPFEKTWFSFGPFCWLRSICRSYLSLKQKIKGQITFLFSFFFLIFVPLLFCTRCNFGVQLFLHIIYQPTPRSRLSAKKAHNYTFTYSYNYIITSLYHYIVT